MISLAFVCRLNKKCLVVCLMSTNKLSSFSLAIVYLAPEALQLFGIGSLYNEGATVNVVCVNHNQRPGFQGSGVWTNNNGGVARGGNTLMFTATREQAGQYTCSVPTVPDIMFFFEFDIVVRCKLYLILSYAYFNVSVSFHCTTECRIEQCVLIAYDRINH